MAEDLDPDDTMNVDDQETEETDPEAGAEAEWTPPSKDEYDKLQREAKRAKDQAAKLRLAAKGAQTPPADEDEVAKARDAATKAAEARYKPVAVRAEAKVLLSDAGFKGSVKTALKLLDLDAVEIDEDGEIDGLDDQIAALKADSPELFDGRKVRSDTRTRRDAAGKEVPVDKPKSSAEKIAANALGR